MSLSIGSRIGAYEITDTLGAGGIGEVYRARDTTLDQIAVWTQLVNVQPGGEGARARPRTYPARLNRAAQIVVEVRVEARMAFRSLHGLPARCGAAPPSRGALA